jgi:FAD/FMN-containing dehydrogenase
LRANILGLEVVLGTGEILDMCSEVRKDNTGVDLK